MNPPPVVITANPAGSPKMTDVYVSAAPTGEYARFQDLTDKLLRVPKSELDARLKKS